jgi:hypothetical protein
MIDQKLDAAHDDPIAMKESLRARALVIQHLKKLRLKNVYVVETLEQMLEAGIHLFRAAQIRAPLERFSPHNHDSITACGV